MEQNVWGVDVLVYEVYTYIQTASWATDNSPKIILVHRGACNDDMTCEHKQEGESTQNPSQHMTNRSIEAPHTQDVDAPHTGDRS